MSVAIAHVEAVVTLDDGRIAKVLISPESISRWGADRETLGEVVDATEAIRDVLREGGHFSTQGRE